jgi:hypothetical protein
MRQILATLLTPLLSAMVALSSGCATAQALTDGGPADPGTATAQPSSVPSPTATATPTPASPTFTWKESASAFCASGCTGLAAWADRTRVPNARIEEALFVLSAYVPELHAVLATNAERGTHLLESQPDDPRAGGTYSSATKLIVISPGYVNDDMAVLASAVAHELVHGAQDFSGSPDICRYEIDAYSWEAFVWERLKPVTRAASPTLDQIASAWHDGSLPRLVASWPLYSTVCAGR